MPCYFSQHILVNRTLSYILAQSESNSDADRTAEPANSDCRGRD